MDYQERYAKLIAALNSDTQEAQNYFKTQSKPLANDFVSFIGDYL